MELTSWPIPPSWEPMGSCVRLSDAFPELAVAIWDAVSADDAQQAFTLQSQFSPLLVNGRYEASPAAGSSAAIADFSNVLPKPLRSVDDRQETHPTLIDAIAIAGRRRKSRWAASELGRHVPRDLLRFASD